ncbi:molybdenum cofactor sulfurase, partial [Genlisea aurea]
MGIDPEKARFLEKFGSDYGYPTSPRSIDEIRATDFKRLNDVVYLDHAGATLYSESQIQSVFNDLSRTLHGNPHSQSNCSSTARDFIGEARRQVLRFFNAPPGEYTCIFTSGATAALKLVGETFPWSSRSVFAYTTENHNSVLGIREYALSKGASSFAVDIAETIGESSFKMIPRNALKRDVCGKSEHDGEVHNLFAFPSECNFSGERFDLGIVSMIKEGSYEFPEASQVQSSKWMVLVDAAKGSATSPPDLSEHKADFVVVSFYKIFGYPTGLGALIARNQSANLLKKTYFGGGTVAASIADLDFHKRRESIEEYLEDGTVSFLSIASLQHGFKILDDLTMPAIRRHTTALASYVRDTLSNLKHENGIHVCTLYGLHEHKEVGPTVSFNLRRSDGSWIGYREVEKLASLRNIQLRTGCFCNPGACVKFLGLSHSDLLSNIESGHVCWDDYDILRGNPTGAVRVSFGYMSTFEDAKKLLKFIEESFASPSSFHGHNVGVERAAKTVCLKSITVYPVKSCAGFSVDTWPLCDTGLLHDREWAVKSPSGEILTQKKVPEMGLITAAVDLKRGLLVVESPRCDRELRIDIASTTPPRPAQSFIFAVFSFRRAADRWFYNAVARPCTLVRMTGGDGEIRLNFANEAQFLLVSAESVADLNARLHHVEVDPSRFRPNLVVSGGDPYEEDRWRSLVIGDASF